MINLLPKQIKVNRSYGRKSLSLIKFSTALMLTAVIAAIVIASGIYYINSGRNSILSEISTNKQTIAKLKTLSKDSETTSSRLSTAKKLSDQSVYFSELIPKIAGIMPKGVVLNSLSLKGGITDPLSLNVNLTDASLAPVLIKNLKESEMFEAADITSLTPIEGNQSSPTQYKFSAQVTASFKGSSANKKPKAPASTGGVNQ